MTASGVVSRSAKKETMHSSPLRTDALREEDPALRDKTRAFGLVVVIVIVSKVIRRCCCCCCCYVLGKN